MNNRTNNPYDDQKTLCIPAHVGRDAGKTFLITEVNPVVMAGLVLRLLAALRLNHQDDLMGMLQPLDDDATRGEEHLGRILRLLTGCDPQAMSALMHDMLAYVEIAPDSQHPSAFRRLNDNDIREMSTLADLLGGFARVNLLPSG